MADITVLARLLNGAMRNVDITSNTPVVFSIKVGGGVSNTELTKAILDRLVSLQNGSDVDATYHTHDGRYYTESELASATASSGSDLIGDDDTYSNFTPAAATIKGALSGIDAALATAGGTSFSDATFEIYDNVDNTKKILLQASGITTSTSRTITMPDADVDLGKVATAIQRDGSVAFTADQSMGGFKLTNLADPVGDQDAATKAFVMAREAGLKPKEAARVAASTNIVIATALESGDIVDGITLATGDRVLLRGQTAPEENGIYVAVASGAASRATDFDSLTPVDEINRAWVPVQEGTDAGKIFVQYGVVATLGTDAINFTFYNPLASLVGGDMITNSGSTFSVDLATVSGLESTNPGNAAGQLRTKLEASNPSLQINGSNELGAKLDGAGTITSGASGLKVGVDASTIEISTNALRVKDAGITLAKLASASVDENKLTTSVAGAGLTGGGGSPLAIGANANGTITVNADDISVNHAPAIRRSETAGETFAASLFAVRMAKAADAGFVAGRVYKADNDATSADNFYVIGLVNSSAAAAATIATTKLGALTVTAHGFTVGAPLFLDAAGAVTETAASAANTAVVRVGMVRDANTIEVQIQVIGVN